MGDLTLLEALRDAIAGQRDDLDANLAKRDAAIVAAAKKKEHTQDAIAKAGGVTSARVRQLRDAQ